MLTRRVAITGLGCVSPLGLSMDASWSSLLAGRCGITPLGEEFSEDLRVFVAGTIHNYDPTLWGLDKKTARRMERFSQFAYSAAKEALADSGLASHLPELSERFGVSIGVGMGGVEFIYNASNRFHHRGPKGVSPFLIPLIIPNMASGMVSNLLQLKGPNICTTTACASGSHGIGEGYLMIKSAMADAMIAGGAESALCHVALAGFANMGALSKSQNPSKASMPYDLQRSGFVMSEGAGVVVLEELERARRRGATIYCELTGYGMTGDAYHMTHPSPHGEGAARCLKQALELSGLEPHDIDHLNAHGTGTKSGDLFEAQAVSSVFSNHTKDLMISATKGATGHLLGGSGGLEACFAALSVFHNLIPPTLPLHQQDPEIVLNVASQTRNHPVNAAMSLSLGFGGTNAALVFQKLDS